MRISNKCLMLLAVPAMLACTAANAMELGPVEGWESGEADIFFFNGDMPDIIGKIDAQGRVEVNLPEDTRTERFTEMFKCFRASEGEISISAPEATYSYGPTLEIARVAEQEYIGELVAFSSADYAREWRASMSAGDNAPKSGSKYNLIYVSEPVRIEGTCDGSMQIDGTGTAPVRMRNEYAIEFDAGWQFLGTETRATVTSSLGVTWATDSLMHSATLDSDGVHWVVFEER